MRRMLLSLSATAVLAFVTAGAALAHEHGTKSDATTQPASRPAPKYTCPMHPDVVSDAPGKCPKCGMKLEPAKQDEPQSQEKDHHHMPGM